jgi:hypothetical protein
MNFTKLTSVKYCTMVVIIIIRIVSLISITIAAKFLYIHTFSLFCSCY